MTSPTSSPAKVRRNGTGASWSPGNRPSSAKAHPTRSASDIKTEYRIGGPCGLTPSEFQSLLRDMLANPSKPQQSPPQSPPQSPQKRTVRASPSANDVESSTLQQMQHTSRSIRRDSMDIQPCDLGTLPELPSQPLSPASSPSAKQQRTRSQPAHGQTHGGSDFEDVDASDMAASNVNKRQSSPVVVDRSGSSTGGSLLQLPVQVQDFELDGLDVYGDDPPLASVTGLAPLSSFSSAVGESSADTADGDRKSADKPPPLISSTSWADSSWGHVDLACREGPGPNRDRGGRKSSGEATDTRMVSTAPRSPRFRGLAQDVSSTSSQRRHSLYAMPVVDADHTAKGSPGAGSDASRLSFSLRRPSTGSVANAKPLQSPGLGPSPPAGTGNAPVSPGLNLRSAQFSSSSFFSGSGTWGPPTPSIPPPIAVNVGNISSSSLDGPQSPSPAPRSTPPPPQPTPVQASVSMATQGAARVLQNALADLSSSSKSKTIVQTLRDDFPEFEATSNLATSNRQRKTSSTLQRRKSIESSRFPILGAVLNGSKTPAVTASAPGRPTQRKEPLVLIGGMLGTPARAPSPAHLEWYKRSLPTAFQLALKWKAFGIQLVAFDFDETLMARHSGGCLQADKLQAYIATGSADCFALLAALLDVGICVGIATFGDEAFRTAKPPEVQHQYIAGRNLVMSVFERLLPSCFLSRLEIVPRCAMLYTEPQAYIPLGLTSPMPISKAYHISVLKHSMCPTATASQVVLVDDDNNNILAAKRDMHLAVLANAAACGQGFTFGDLMGTPLML